MDAEAAEYPVGHEVAEGAVAPVQQHQIFAPNCTKEVFLLFCSPDATA